jgi:hypothetical protein
MKRPVLLAAVAFISALAGAAGGAALQQHRVADQIVTGDQLNRLAIVGQCRIEPGNKPFANCTAQRLTGVFK